MDVINGRLELLESKEKLLIEQLNDVKNKKRKLNDTNDCNTNNSNLNKNSVSSHYSESFDCNIESKNAFIPTVKVRLKLNGIIYGPTRGFLDTGAQPNLMSFQLHRNYRFNPLPAARRVVGIDGEPFSIKSKIIAKVLPWYDTNNENGIEDTFWILPKDCKWQPVMPTTMLNANAIRTPVDVQLADPEYWKPDQVFMLFGVGFFAKVITSVIQRNVDGTAIMNTTIGAIVFGSQSEKLDERTGKVVSSISFNQEDQLDKLLERLWQNDQVESHSKFTEEENLVETHFMQTHRRDKNGRFIVHIPLRDNVSNIGSSRDIALKRFMYLERKLMKNRGTKEIYTEKINDLMRLGHLKLVDKRPKDGEMVYYIPHHCIPKDNRIVYDASCKTNKGISLNDIQLLGPKLQKDLQEIIMRFRRHRIAIYADIRKMFNQVKLAPEQWNLQRIFWREDPKHKLKEYWLTVVIFGLTASPFLAVRSVIQTARESKENHPIAAKAIEEDFYMDDCTTGAETVGKAIKLAREIDSILRKAGFELRQWKSNGRSVVEAMDSEPENTVLFSEGEGTTILGLKWLINVDKFTFVVKNAEIEEKVTKRKIVSHVAQLYDPNGYISPVTIVGKIIIQDLWKIRIEWDENLPVELERRWIEYWKSIIHLQDFKLDRWLGTASETSIHIHGFSDSSEAALGAVLYVRAEHPNGMITSKLLTSKTKVAPLKTVTIPRLELAAAELLGRLVKRIMESMEWASAKYTLWLDSSPAYFWMKRIPRELKTYVGNRVASIQENTDINCWRHIDGKENPADLLSRGIPTRELINNRMWLHGPYWLSLSEDQWPKSKIMQENEEEMQKEMRIHAISSFKDPLRIGIRGTNTHVPLVEYANKLEKAVNILSYVARFIKLKLSSPKGRPKRNKAKGMQLKLMPPTKEEKATAMEYLIRKAQQEFYNKEITALKAQRNLPEKCKIECLKPILDQKDILRVGGRLGRAEMDYEMKHPAIIPNGSRLAWLLIDYAHRQTKHGGVQLMMQFIRQNYWIPKLRNELRNYVHKCVVCVRLNAQLEDQLMSELPAERVQLGKAFLHTGIDYAGPFELKMVGTEKRKKCWIAIFVCLKTRAVHIDIVMDISSASFLACYERFIGKRGRCEKLFSDNGTAFVGAEKELQRALEKWISKEFLDHIHNKGTQWQFMTPAAPHQGGIYEAAVKSMKFHLKRIVGQRILQFEQMYTLLNQIEAILNSRPLHPLNDDPNDMQALTPGHFLVGEPLILPLPFDLDNRPDTKGLHFLKERQKMIGHFWDRWRMEYLTTLQERKKWRREKEELKIGQLVVLKHEHVPPTNWPLGRIQELIRSKDGIVRNVVVKTVSTTLKRPVQKICIIPVESAQLSD